MGFTLLCEQAISKEMSDIFMMFMQRMKPVFWLTVRVSE